MFSNHRGSIDEDGVEQLAKNSDLFAKKQEGAVDEEDENSQRHILVNHQDEGE